VTLWDKEKRKVIIINVVVPNTYYMMENITKKPQEYCEFQQDINKKWKVEDVDVFLLIISNTTCKL